MTTEWHERWREGRIGFHRPEVHPTLTDIARSRRVFPGKVFVPLAGKTVDLMWLAQAGAEVVAVELVNEAVRAFFEEQNVEFTQSQDGPLTVYQARTVALTFYQGDVFDLEARHLKDVTWTHDRASLVALSESLRTRYGAHLSHVLPEDVELLVTTFEYDQSEMSGPPFSVPLSEVERVFPDFHFEHGRSRDVFGSATQLKERGVSRIEEQVFIGSRT